MKNLNFKHIALSSVLVYVLGISAFVGSYFVDIMEDPDLQANIVLMVAIIPAAYVGAHFYYKRGYRTHGVLLGFIMFLGAILLDAIITVPVFIIPNGGDHISFFTDLGFWFIGFEYVGTITAYWQFNVTKPRVKQLS